MKQTDEIRLTSLPGGMNTYAISFLLAVATVVFIDPAPIQYSIYELSGERIDLDTYAIFVCIVIAISINKNITQLFSVETLYILIFVAFLIVSSMWSNSEKAAETYMLQAISIIPISFALGLCMSQCDPLHICLLYIFVAAASYLFFQPDFSDYEIQKGLFVTYQGYARCYWVAAIGALVSVTYFRNPVTRIVLYISALFLIMAILSTGGRGGILSFIVSIMAIIAYKYEKFRTVFIVFSTVIYAFVLIMFNYFASDLYTFAQNNGFLSLERLASPASSDGLEYDRNVLAMKALELFSENPFFGAGLGGYPVNSGYGDDPGLYPHNTLLEVLAEQGLFGAILFCGMILLFLARYLRVQELLPETQKLYILAFGAGFLAEELVSGHVESSIALWLIAGHVVSLSYKYKRSTISPDLHMASLPTLPNY
jgi:O-antigen ligase